MTPPCTNDRHRWVYWVGSKTGRLCRRCFACHLKQRRTLGFWTVMR